MKAASYYAFSVFKQEHSTAAGSPSRLGLESALLENGNGIGIRDNLLVVLKHLTAGGGGAETILLLSGTWRGVACAWQLLVRYREHPESPGLMSSTDLGGKVTVVWEPLYFGTFPRDKVKRLQTTEECVN